MQLLLFFRRYFFDQAVSSCSLKSSAVSKKTADKSLLVKPQSLKVIKAQIYSVKLGFVHKKCLQIIEYIDVRVVLDFMKNCKS